MAAKREQIFWNGVWPIAKELEKVYSLKAICSGGILALNKMDSKTREACIAEANSLSIKSQESQSSSCTIREVLKTIAKKAQGQQGGEVELPGTVIRIESAELNQLIKSLGPEPEQKKITKRG